MKYFFRIIFALFNIAIPTNFIYVYFNKGQLVMCILWCIILISVIYCFNDILKVLNKNEKLLK